MTLRAMKYYTPIVDLNDFEGYGWVKVERCTITETTISMKYRRHDSVPYSGSDDGEGTKVFNFVTGKTVRSDFHWTKLG
ncbi:hypothetical protein KIPB_003836 [Kipferlia bialata]|uniref:Uncharacterized protein n=1 Tax=Kipferlia bialata TaxID=797122 RepID=A0A9K3GGZ6_9EUKA|nr:hypothetical protein KIPB_003836 [Kipferlia bialata]|eukprot:g3836.t1